jgi:hypothetical protein
LREGSEEFGIWDFQRRREVYIYSGGVVELCRRERGVESDKQREIE